MLRTVKGGTGTIITDFCPNRVTVRGRICGSVDIYGKIYWKIWKFGGAPKGGSPFDEPINGCWEKSAYIKW